MPASGLAQRQPCSSVWLPLPPSGCGLRTVMPCQVVCMCSLAHGCPGQGFSGHSCRPSTGYATRVASPQSLLHHTHSV